MILRALPAVALSGLAACGSKWTVDPPAKGSVAPAVLIDAVAACSAQPPVGKAIAEDGLKQAGWTPTERVISKGPERSTLPPAEARVLADDEFEGSTWSKPNVSANLHVSRNPMSMGECTAEAVTVGGPAAMVRALERQFGRTADRIGTRPLGGDQLTPRSDKPVPSRMWQLAAHDVYLLEFEGGSVRAEVVAMPDRATLDRYDPANPKSRIYVEGEK